MKLLSGITIIVIAAIAGVTSTAFASAKSTQHSAPSMPQPNSSPTADAIWIGKADEATSCNIKSGIAIDAMAGDLSRAGVKVFEKKKVHDAQMHIAMCGVDKGTLNGFLISKKDLAKALGLGFRELPNSDR